MERIGIGRSAEVFRTEDGTAVKLFYDWVQPGHIENERLRAAAISAVYPDAPRFIRTGEWLGRHGLEMEYIQGVMGSDYLMRNPLRVRQILAQFALLHKEMNRIEVPSLPGQTEKFQNSITVCAYLEKETREQLLAFLAAREDMPFLCHGDLHPENVMVDEQGRFRIIDWLDAYHGDPMGDVARSYYLLGGGTSPVPKTGFVEKMVYRMRPFLAEQYLRYYYRGEKIFEKDWLTWQLIIQTARIQEGIPEELPRLHQSIRILEKALFQPK